MISPYLAPFHLFLYRYNGTVNNMKLLCSFVVMGFYTGVGVYSSVYEPMQKSNTSTTPKKPSQQPTGLDIHQLEAGDRGSESKKLSGHDGLGIGRAVKSIKHSVNDKINANLLKKKTVLDNLLFYYVSSFCLQCV